MNNLISNIKHLPTRLRRVTSSTNYIHEIDGLRFLAIFPVVIQHLNERLIKYYPQTIENPLEGNLLSFFASRGTVGVFIFFAISGFILSLPFARHYLHGSKKVEIKTFLLRRFTRLEPPYIFWMTIFLLVLISQGSMPIVDLIKHWLASIFYLHNVLYQGYSIINPIAWTLEIEIQFYLLAPFITFIFFSIKDKLVRRLAIVAFIFLWMSLQHYHGWIHYPQKLTLLAHLHYFLIGFLATDLYLESRSLLKKYLLFDLIGVLAFFTLMITWSEEYLKSILFTVALLLLIISAFKGKLLNKFLSNNWIASIGGMCYTIYLIHLPLLEFQFNLTRKFITIENYYLNFLIQFLIALPLIIGISAIFFLIIEKPFMEKDWHRKLAGKFKGIQIFKQTILSKS